MAGRRTFKQLAEDSLKPIATLSEPVEQCDIGHINQANRGRPGGNRPQATLTEAVGQHQAQHIGRAFHGPGALKCTRRLRTRRSRVRAAKALDDQIPVPV
jgi:hypothetical protein